MDEMTKYTPFCYAAWHHMEGVTEHGVWFRIFGYGLWIGINSPVYFSERYGHKRVLRIGKLAMSALYP